MYDWRKMNSQQRNEVLKLRKEKGLPWHSPPHKIGDTDYYHLCATCYEHQPIIGATPTRIAEFTAKILDQMKSLLIIVFAWCILPNHWHMLIKSSNILDLLKEIGRFHGRQSYRWNGEENCRGRKVWYNALDRYIRSERHFWATMNYIHHNPVHHHYVTNWQDWPFSSAIEFLEKMGKEKTAEIWRKYPILDYGKGWDDPHM